MVNLTGLDRSESFTNETKSRLAANKTPLKGDNFILNNVSTPPKSNMNLEINLTPKNLITSPETSPGRMISPIESKLQQNLQINPFKNKISINNTMKPKIEGQ